MDSFDIFKKLTKGAKFRKETSAPLVKNPTSKSFTPVKIKDEEELNNKEDYECDDELSEDEAKDNIKEYTYKISDDTYSFQYEDEVNRFRNFHNISVKGSNIPPPIRSFQELANYEVSQQVLANIMSFGYNDPTPIQMQAIPIMNMGRQILACAPTGSGKTLAFLIPVVGDLKKPSRKGFRALIVCPTRELARQTFRECVRLTQETGLKPHIITKVKENKFGPNFSKKFDILISTPNRLVFLLKQENSILSLQSVEWLVVDESDKLFETGKRGFREQLAEIYKSCTHSKVKRAMFSATYTPQVAMWCKKNLKEVISVTVGHRNTTVQHVEQELIFVGDEHGKMLAFRELIQQGLTPPVLVFVQSKERAKQLFNELIFDEINVDVIHADRTQTQRDNVVRAFREGKIWVLICTELMGRGIDFKGVKLVINYDFPPSAISYIHRIGRTGRAGRPGKAITYFTKDDKLTLRSIAAVMRESGCNVPDYMLKLKRLKKSEKIKLKYKSVPDRKPITTAPKPRKRVFKRKTDGDNYVHAKKKKVENEIEQSDSTINNMNLKKKKDYINKKAKAQKHNGSVLKEMKRNKQNIPLQKKMKAKRENSSSNIKTEA